MDPITIAMLASMAASAGAGIYGAMNGPSSQKSMDELAKFTEKVGPYYQPYIASGYRAQGNLEQQLAKLLQDPGALMAMLSEGYEKSPGYDFQYDQAMRGIDSAAAAGGMMGTPSHQLQAGTMAQGLANQDFYNYLNKILQMYGGGMKGLMSMYNTGFNASNTMGNLEAQNLLHMAELAGNKAEEKGSIFGSIAGGAAGLGGLTKLKPL